MKALTLHQPWASLVAEGHKWIETRSWATPYRGPLAIHAGKSERALDYLCWMEEHQGEAEPALIPLAERITAVDTPRGFVKAMHDLPLGQIIATCTLADVVPIGPLADPRSYIVDIPQDHQYDEGLWLIGVNEVTHGTPTLVDDQREFGDFTPGRFAWLLTDIVKVEPVEARGRQSLWEWAA